MNEPIQFAPRLAVVPKGKLHDPLAGWAAVREMEMRANLAELRVLQRIERRSLMVVKLVDCWPIAAGLLLGVIAPTLQALVASVAPWAMSVVFPFVVLAGRPELHLTGAFAHYVPLVVLYAQFPIEGLLAKRVLKRKITLPGVALQVSFYHFLGAMQLLLISGTIQRMFIR